MKIAIIEDKILTNALWRNMSEEQMIVKGYSIVEIPGYANPDILTIEEFEQDGVCYRFSGERYTALINKIMRQRYVEQVEALIKLRYSAGDEMAILRQKDTKPDEYMEYNKYIEECKNQAKLNTYKNPYQYESLYLGLIKN